MGTLGEGGVYFNNERVTEGEWTPVSDDLIAGMAVLRRGKKNFAGIRVS